MENQKVRFRFHKARVYTYVLAISLGGFLFGFGQVERTLIYFHDASLKSIYELAALVGAMVGAFLGYWLISYGRRMTMIFAAIQFATACVLSIVPIPYGPYYIAIKFFIGIGVGYESFICPLFSMVDLTLVYEIAPFYVRGRLIAFHQLMITIGVFYGSLFEYIYPSDQNQNLEFPEFWVKSIVVFVGPMLVCVLIILLFLFKYPLETPPYYLSKQNYFEVKEAIGFIYQQSEVRNSISSIVTQSRQNVSQLGENIQGQHKWRAFVAATGVLIIQILTGINSILLKLFQVGDKEQFQILIIAGINIVSLFSFIFFLHNVPRKILLVGGLMLLSSCQASVLCFTNGINKQTFVYFLSCCFVFVFQFSIGPIAWIQVHQILEPKLAAIATSLNWFFNFIVAMLTLRFESNFTVLTIIFSSVCFVVTLVLCQSAFVIMWLYPETNHKTKKEIQNFLLDWNPSFWKPTFLESSDMGSINESEHNNNN